MRTVPAERHTLFFQRRLVSLMETAHQNRRVEYSLSEGLIMKKIAVYRANRKRGASLENLLNL